MSAAVNYLLALMLCLNGFGMPSAMAHGGNAGDQVASPGPVASCHTDPLPASTTDVSVAVKHAQPHEEGGSCCENGQCFCGCIVSAVFTLPLLATSPHPVSARMSAPDVVDFPLAQGSVLQRPPIV